MKGNKYIAATLVIVFFLSSYANSVAAKNLKSITKGDFPIIDELNACGERCDPKDHECPMECLKNIAGKDETTFTKFLQESQVAFRGAFCIAGCAATEACEPIRAGSKGRYSLNWPPIKFIHEILISMVKFYLFIVFVSPQRIKKGKLEGLFF